MTIQKMTLGTNLDEARQDAGLTIRQLAELSGVAKSVVGRLLLDQLPEPKPDHLVRLAQVLEVRASDLFLLAGIPVPDQLPTVEALLRADYDLSEAAVAEVRAQIDAIVARYASTAPGTHKTISRKEADHEQN